MMFLAQVVLGVALPSGCLPINDEWIRAGHVAAALPAFRATDAKLPISRSPVAGARRVLHSAELVRFARAHEISVEAFPDVCFEWPMRVRTDAEVVEALSRAAGVESSAVELVERTQLRAPEGELHFPPQSQTRAPEAGRGAVLWRGSIRYQAGFTGFPVWAKVRIAKRVYRVVARADLLAGTPITESQVEVAGIEDPREPAVYAENAEEVIGRVLRRPVAAGGMIRRTELVSPPVVVAGERVRVEVRNGRLRILYECRAERSAGIGDVIPVSNLDSGKRFSARVEGKGLLSVTLPSGAAGRANSLARASTVTGGEQERGKN